MEVEIRFKNIDKDQWKKIYKTLLENAIGKVTESITITEQHKRYELYFVNQVKTDEKYIEKILLESYQAHNVIYYKVASSQEKEIVKFAIGSRPKIRMRIRSSLLIDNVQYDFTLVKDIDKLEDVKQNKEKYFSKTKLDAKNYLAYIEKIENSNIFNYELEAELLDLPNKTKLANIRDDISAIVKNIAQIINPAEDHSVYHEKVYQIAKLLLADQDKLGNVSKNFINKFGLKQLVSQPINLTPANYASDVLPHISNFYLSDKADGDRALLCILPNEQFLLKANDIEPIDIIHKYTGTTILDVELVDKEIYAFDCLFYDGEKLTSLTMQEREKFLDKAIADRLIKHLQKKILIRLTNNQDPEHDYRVQIKELYAKKFRLYPIDGLIFTNNLPGDTSKYNSIENYFDSRIYKWKPPEKMTIDFLMMRAPDFMVGVEPYMPKEGFDIYFLFCGVRQNIAQKLGLQKIAGYHKIFVDYKFPDAYFPIQFTTPADKYAYVYYHPQNKYSIKELHGHIVEFGYENGWQIHRLRPDRDINVEKNIGFGNDYLIAVETFESYKNPFTIDQLTETKIGSGYFATQKKSQYRALTKYNAFVKAQLIRQIEKSKWVVDLASGKGQDLFVYNGFGVQNGLFIDLDKEALQELNQRRLDFDKPEYYVYTPMPTNSISVFTKNLDLTEPAADNLAKIFSDHNNLKNGADAVVINFALHYLINSKESLDNFINLVSALLRPGGILIITCFNAEAVVKKLKNIETGKSWDVMENNELKYSIKKLYTDDKFTNPFGKKISLIHPFSNGEYYEENLVHIPTLIKAFKDQNYLLRQNGSFQEWLSKYQKFSPKFSAMLTQNDQDYASLYQYVSLLRL
jgi:SAM-dependent methyltransferase